MSPPKWLPPLNSHGQYQVSAMASQLELPRNNPTLSQPTFVISTHVSVIFYSICAADSLSRKQSSEEKPFFKGLSMHKDFSVPCYALTSPAFFQETIHNMLREMIIPFETNSFSTWQERHLDGEEVVVMGDVDDDIVGNIRDFARCMRGRYYNAGHNILPIRLSITKRVEIPDVQLRRWKFWYNENSRDDPSFNRDYRDAISRPRTGRELMYGENPEVNAARKSDILCLVHRVLRLTLF